MLLTEGYKYTIIIKIFRRYIYLLFSTIKVGRYNNNVVGRRPDPEKRGK